jgi:light-regulated signal transduction histidine kinase (bacteriophytochrome)
MSQKSSVPQAISFVSQVLKRDIGLPLCRSIVEAHRGRLWLDKVSQGASIRFTRPIARKCAHD